MTIQLEQTNDDEELVESHDINVTPFIDVMLVLLIIFMVAAPLATVDIPVDLPASNTSKQLRHDTPIIFTIKEDLSLALGDTPISHLQLAAQLDQVTAGDRKTRLFIRADKAVPYGDLMAVMNKLRAAGYLKIGLVGIELTQ
ncbi:MAG: TonB system transport protein ExbD [Gammaproteobacteria bacterium]|nr:TonB system transport protein ExbD [Gammaproteobacteria bacterium]